MTDALKRPTRKRRGPRLHLNDAHPLFGIAPGGGCPANCVAAVAVRAYRTVSPLPCGVRTFLCLSATQKYFQAARKEAATVWPALHRQFSTRILQRSHSLNAKIHRSMLSQDSVDDQAMLQSRSQAQALPLRVERWSVSFLPLSLLTVADHSAANAR